MSRYFNVKQIEMVQNITIVTTADQYKVVYDLSIGAIFNDLERPQPRFQDQANT